MASLRTHAATATCTALAGSTVAAAAAVLLRLCVQKMNLGVVGGGWGPLASVRWFLSCVCFAFFVFEPAIYDVFLLAAASSTAALMAATSRCSWPCSLAAAAAAAAAATAPTKNLHLAEVIRSPSGVILAAFVAAGAVGVLCKLQDILVAIVAARRVR